MAEKARHIFVRRSSPSRTNRTRHHQMLRGSPQPWWNTRNQKGWLHRMPQSMHPRRLMKNIIRERPVPASSMLEISGGTCKITRPHCRRSSVVSDGFKGILITAGHRHGVNGQCDAQQKGGVSELDWQYKFTRIS